MGSKFKYVCDSCGAVEYSTKNAGTMCCKSCGGTMRKVG